MLHNINILIHVIAGMIAMFIAIGAYASKKGGKNHRLFGRVFLILMAVVIFTALNGVLLFRDRPFLTVVTMLSFYTSYSGYRVLKTKNKGFQWIDFIVMVLVFAVGISFIFKMESANILWDSKVIYYLLLYVFAITGFDMIRFFRPNLISNPRFWVCDHIYKMTASFTALVSAGAGTVFSEYEPLNQIVPAMFSTVWLVSCLFYFSKYARNKKDLVNN